MNRRACHAFTLLEVLLAIALVVGLIGASLAFYQHILVIRAAVTNQVELVASQRRIMDRLSDELRSALNSSFYGLGLRGESDSVRFLTASLPAESVWHQYEGDRLRRTPAHDLRLVGYRLGDEGAGLERTEQTLLTVRAAEEGKHVRVALLTPVVTGLRFRYWDGANWHPRWDAARMPRAIEITMGSAAALEKASHGSGGVRAEDGTCFRRIVSMPAAQHLADDQTIATEMRARP
jgi:type II secretory pathway component PulJ